MKSPSERSTWSPVSQARSTSRLSDSAPPVIIFMGARKAFKEPAWIIRTTAKARSHGRA